MIRPHEERLARAILGLRVDRVAWEEFLVAVAGYSAAITDNCISATPDLLPQAQGRAQAMRSFLTSLHEAPAVVEKLENMKRAHAPKP